MQPLDTVIGRARTALVFDQGNAVLSAVIARVRRGRGRKRLTFHGPVLFEPEVVRHLNEAVLPLVDQILVRLGLKERPKSFELSMVNVGAASVADTGIIISGFSADVAIFLALLSAALRMPLPQDLVVTGHIASSGGDIGPVSSIPAKLGAAVENRRISRFICPSPDMDDSLRLLAPEEAENAADALTRAKGRLRIVQVTNVSELMQAVVDEEAMVMAGLLNGFFQLAGSPEPPTSIVEETAHFLAQDNDQRFWRSLERLFYDGCVENTRTLLLARSRYQVRVRRYAPDLGRRLLQLLRSLPPAIRRTEGLFPLLTMEHCLRLCRFAGEQDHEDVRYLLDAASGRIHEPLLADEPHTTPSPSGATDRVAAVLAEISAESIARKIGIPIDAARASFIIGDAIIDSYDCFLELITAFYLVLLRHTGSQRASIDEHTIRSESFALLERAFSDKGGVNAAWAEVRCPVTCGLGFVLNVVTQRFKTEMRFKHIQRVVQEATDPLNWDSRVTFTAAMLEYMGPALPPEIRAAPAARFAAHCELLLQEYSESLDRVATRLRSL